MIRKSFINESKGSGYFATKEIPAGQLVLSESPGYLIDIKLNDRWSLYLMAIADLYENHPQIYQQFEKLVPNEVSPLDLFLSKVDEKLLKEIVMSNPKLKAISQWDSQRLWLHFEKFSRNAFSFHNGQSVILLFKGTLFNHSCHPNVIYFQKDNQMYFVTNRKISQGEELTISYANSYKKPFQRQGVLLKYGFICTCSVCSKKKHPSTLQNLKNKYYSHVFSKL
jgi:hypothetical protein